MRKLLYVCDADSGGIMGYAIRQSEAIEREGVKAQLLCRENTQSTRPRRASAIDRKESHSPPSYSPFRQRRLRYPSSANINRLQA
jgi:hypothetical protein